ncbi:MAG: FAD-binding oxidoreductase [Acidobacteria bacterium]|nr:FAD-binding oxidoreductase [Acidobacteriota bacterium]
MAHTADVVIIGAGIVGSSVAYHLTEAGCKNVLVLERETRQGLGSTGKSMGGVRAQFATDVNIGMSLYSIPFFDRFEEATGHPSGYKAHGYLFMATRPSHMEYLRANRERQVALGLKGVELLEPGDIVRMLPQLRADDIVGGSFCPTDGFVDPHLVMSGFMARALECGATLWREAEVTGIEVDGDAVAGVRTTQGPVATRTLVNAAGPWASRVAQMAGVDLPVEPLRRMLVPTEPFPGLPEKLPMVIDMSTGFHFRREGVGLLLAWADPDETPGFKTSFDPAFIEKILTHAANRVPCFAELAVNPKRCWAGMYEVTPDHHAILGPAPGVRGLFLANGFSGHGVMHSPATGRLTAEWILYGEPRLLDARLLGAGRFAAGRLLEETAVL